jgi:hypothetical protein
MPASPRDYTWLSTTHFSAAGCVTVVADADGARVRTAFGASLEPLPGSGIDLLGEWPAHLEPGVEWVWFTSAGPASVVVEDNNFQGSRSEVLRAASRASGVGKAASIFWNVNGLAIFTCARRGKVVSSVDLSLVDESDLEGLPRSLHKLALSCDDDDADLIGVGAAMVEKFTGVAFGPDVLLNGSAHEMTPVPSDLESFTAQAPPWGLRMYPALVAAVAALDTETQRAFGEFATTVAVKEAGIENEPGVAATVAQFGTGEPGRLDPRAEVLRAEVNRRTNLLSTQAMERESSGGLEVVFGHQKSWALGSLRQSTNHDALSAALGAADGAVGAALCSRRERGETYTEDDKGRRLTDSVNPAAGRGEEFVRVLTEVATTGRARWDDLGAALPAPFTEAEREAILVRDRQLEAEGAFQVYSIWSGNTSGNWAEGPETHIFEFRADRFEDGGA